ncbi:MAG: hypothetical protein IJ760_02040 [Bacteroidales bacterium]|nr:hypothetical protein [Bacteroidales bacterium]
MTRHSTTAALLLLAALLAAGCKGERCDTPFGEGGELDLLQPDFFGIYNTPGATLAVNRGHKGILVHCVNLGEYVAFDCACPVCHDVRLLPDDNTAATLLACPVCSSSYDLFFGSPMPGSAGPCPLYQYEARCMGHTLIIY